MVEHAAVRQSRERYGFLDVLRGVAALAVVLYHVGNRVGAPSLVTHGYLAVDFFFILSGFVIAHSYADRMPRMGFWRFTRLRAERLLPLSVVGVLIGLLYMLARWHVQPNLSDDLSGILGAAALNLVLIPKLWLGRSTADEMFPENGALWSLSLELMANLAWAKLLVGARSRSIIVLMILGLGMAAWSASRSGDANVGWGLGNYIGGVGRVSFGFLMGVLLWRHRSYATPRPGAALLAGIALVVVLCLPRLPWWMDIVIAATALPIIVYLASRASQGVEGTVARMLGELSFPLYAVHLPILMMLSGALKSHGVMAGWWTYGIVLPIAVLAFAAARLYDEPIRRRLAAWRGGRATSQPFASIERAWRVER